MEQSIAQRGLWVALIGGRGPDNGTLKRWPHFLRDRPQEKLEIWQPGTHILEAAPVWRKSREQDVSVLFPDFLRLWLGTAQARDVSVAIDVGTALTSDTPGPLAQGSLR